MVWESTPSEKFFGAKFLARSATISPLTLSDAGLDFQHIREMGATAVCLAHHQQAQHVLDLCNRDGLLVWQEVPLVNEIGGSVAFAENAKQQLTEMIRQCSNHPSRLQRVPRLVRPRHGELQRQGAARLGGSGRRQAHRHTEYGAGANPAQHQEGPLVQPKTIGSWHPEEWQSHLHERLWGMVGRRSPSP